MNPLTSCHLHMLEKESGITREVIKARGYRTIEKKVELEALGFARPQRNVPSLLIPIYNSFGEVSLYQSRPDTPRINKGKPVKYETPSGSRMTLDIHPFAKDKLGDPATPLFITEGIKKADALVSKNLCTVGLIGVWNWRGSNEHGGKTVLPDWEHIALNNRQVYIVFDSDVMEKLPVHKALERLRGFLESRDAKIKLIYLPSGDGAAKLGVDDYLATGKTVDDLLAFATSNHKAPPEVEKENKGSGLPTIVTNYRHTKAITADSLAALEKANTPPWLYRRGNALARVSDQAELDFLGNASLKGELDRVANFVAKKDARGELIQVPAKVPGEVATDILSRPSKSWNFPNLESIVKVPVLLPSGEILLKEGYNPDSGILLHLNGLEGLRSDIPVDEALELLLNNAFVDFPFVEAAGKAHTLTLLLQTFVRPVITGPTPLYLIDAPARGTGKGLLSDATALIVTGKSAPVMSLPRDGDELEKRITAMLLASSNFILLDNVTTLEGDALNAALTSELWRGRRLGKSEMLEVNNHATWLATGNNVTLSDEMARRTIPIRLDAGVERPEERKNFRHKHLPDFVTAHRP